MLVFHHLYAPELVPNMAMMVPGKDMKEYAKISGRTPRQHFHRDVRGLAAVHFAADNALGILNRDAPLAQSPQR